MNRLMFLSLILLMSCQALPETDSHNPPNFIIIFCDDLGYGDLGVYGNELIHTQHLDKMAQEGIRFTDFYSAYPVCSPSRAGLLTGRHPMRMGIQQVFFPESWTGMASEEITLAEALKEKGYATGMVGKWHLGHLEKYLPLQQGFDSYFGIPYSNDMKSVVYLRGNEVIDFRVDQQYITQRYTEESLKFLEANHDKSFFLYLAHSMPHVPLYASKAFKGKSKAGLYGDVIEEIDWSTGQILDKLDELGISEETIVVFTSDNGPWLAFGPEGGSAGPLREGKQFTFEGGMRVPGIIRWKGRIPAGTVSTDLVSTLDLFPTLLGIAGGELPSDRAIDGIDIQEHLLTNKSLGDRELAFYMGGEYRAYRSGNWKVKLPFKGAKANDWQVGVAPHDTLLFDLSKDIGEQQDLSKVAKAKLREMIDKMKAFEHSMGELPKRLVIRTGADTSHLRKKRAREK